MQRLILMLPPPAGIVSAAFRWQEWLALPADPDARRRLLLVLALALQAVAFGLLVRVLRRAARVRRADAALQREFLEGLPVLGFSLDRRGRVRSWGGSLAGRLDYAPPEAAKLTWRDLLAPDAAPAFAAVLEVLTYPVDPSMTLQRIGTTLRDKSGRTLSVTGILQTHVGKRGVRGLLWQIAPGAASPAVPRSAPAADPIPRPVPAPVKPAVWQDRPAAEAWCPANVLPHLSFPAPEYRDAYALAGHPSPPWGWDVLGATRRGRQHAHRAGHREDAFRWEAAPDFLVCAVSDGAGAYPLSRIGSETACRAVTGQLRDRLTERREALAALSDAAALTQAVGEELSQAGYAAFEAITELASKSQTQPKDFRCTLLLAALCVTARAQTLVVCQIGDGIIAALLRDGTTRRYGEADSGQYSGQVKFFVPDREALDKLTQIVAVPLDHLEALALCTDGIEDAFDPMDRRMGEMFRQLYGGVESPLIGFERQATHPSIVGADGASNPAALEQWLAFEKRGENDDRTLLLLRRQPPGVTADRIKTA